MRTRRRRLPRTRAAARLPGSLKFGVTNDASANPRDGQNGFLLAEVHAIEQAQCSHQCLAPDPGYYLLMTLFYTATTRASLCAQASDDSRRGRLLRTHERNYPFAARECSEPSGRLGARPRAARVVRAGAKQVIP